MLGDIAHDSQWHNLMFWNWIRWQDSAAFQLVIVSCLWRILVQQLVAQRLMSGVLSGGLTKRQTIM